VGMLWASNPSKLGHALVTPIREILDSLYNITGSEFSLKPIDLEEDDDLLIYDSPRREIRIKLEKGQFDGPPIIHTDPDEDIDLGGEMAHKTSLSGLQKASLYTSNAEESPSSGPSKFSRESSSSTESKVVGAVLTHATQSFLARLVQLASEQSSAEEQEDNDDMVGTTSKSDSNNRLAPLVITPVHILRAIRAGTEFDFLTNAGMATGSSRGGAN